MFQFDNTVSNPADKFKRGMERVVNYIGIHYNNSEDIFLRMKRIELVIITVPRVFPKKKKRMRS